MTIASTSTEQVRHASHDDYQPMLTAVAERFKVVTGGYSTAELFTTDATDLWSTWLEALPSSERQHHNCAACRHFIENFGHLTVVNDDGSHAPVFSVDAPGIYKNAFAPLWRRVAGSHVTGVFYSSLQIWGTPSNHDRKRNTQWHHLSVIPPAGLVYKDSLKTAKQEMAEKREDYAMLCRALTEFDISTVNQALSIARSEALYRGEKVLGHLEWLADLRARLALTYNMQTLAAITWRAVATAPAGFCHVKSSMIGTLLEDVAAGLPFETIKRKFTEKMNPLQYQRPSAPPTAGAIAQAEKVVATLRSAGALRRRYARLEDIQALWLPAQKEMAPVDGVFGHLKPKSRDPFHPIIEAPPHTWEKFQRTVITDAASIEIYVPNTGRFIALATAVDPSAPPILQWDREDVRNPVSWYVYPNGSSAEQWSLVGNSYAKVNAVTLFPFMWKGALNHGHHGAGVIFIVNGAKRTDEVDAAIFPEILKSEYHGIRSVLEAYSNKERLEGRKEATACGIELRKGAHDPVTLLVTSRMGARTKYRIDRWD